MTKRKYSENADHNEVINKLYESIRELQSENRQLKLALGPIAIKHTFSQLVKDIRKRNRYMGRLIDKAYIRRFDPEKVWLAFNNLDRVEKYCATTSLIVFLKAWTLKHYDKEANIKIFLK